MTMEKTIYYSKQKNYEKDLFSRIIVCAIDYEGDISGVCRKQPTSLLFLNESFGFRFFRAKIQVLPETSLSLFRIFKNNDEKRM